MKMLDDDAVVAVLNEQDDIRVLTKVNKLNKNILKSWITCSAFEKVYNCDFSCELTR